MERLLDYLLEKEVNTEACRSARQYMLCQSFASKIGANADVQQTKATLTAYWHALEVTCDSNKLSKGKSYYKFIVISISHYNYCESDVL